MYSALNSASKDKVVTMESLNLAEYSTSKEAIQYYFRGATVVTVGVLTSAVTYPLAVRIAKRVFRLKDFLNIHMVPPE
jgi:hypothetical protein